MVDRFKKLMSKPNTNIYIDSINVDDWMRNKLMACVDVKTTYVVCIYLNYDLTLVKHINKLRLTH